MKRHGTELLMSDDIVVSGIACRFPDANTPTELWDNVLAKRKAFRRIPEERLNIADYDPNHSLYEDSIYINQAAVLTDYQFDRLEFNISGGAYRSADLTHWLALECAKEALVDSGVLNNNAIDVRKVGVIVGNTLTGDMSRSSSLRLRWPYVRKVLTKTFENKGLDNSAVNQIIGEVEQLYKAPFEVPSEETLSGGLANTIAGRICNYFDFGGGGYTIDGACSSSLLAVVNACTALESGELDVVITGGVDLSIDPFELVGFSRSKALAQNQMAVYSNLANGFLPGEGCGMLVLTKASFAEKAELKQYVSIKGWGISSDGKGGLTRPDVKGQKLAIERCYKKAGYSPCSVKLFEGHGTGTPVGDSVELQALNLARDGSSLIAVLGSVKSNIGHTKAAAGSAGLIKIIKALENKVLPPHTETENKNTEFESANNSLSLLDTSAPWPDNVPLRAGVSSFGFGGINVHISIERELGKGINSENKVSDFAKSKYSFQGEEAFFLAADTDIELIEILTKLTKRAVSMSLAEMADCSASIVENIRGNRLRAAFVASDPDEIKSKSEALLAYVSLGKEVIDTEKNIYFSSRLEAPEIGYMFTGQGGPIRLNGGALGKRFQCVSDQYSSLNSPLIDDRTTRSAQNAITQSQLATLKILDHLGVKAKHAIGHSLGELSALHWAKAIDSSVLTELVDARGRAMTEFAEHDGSMVAVSSSAEVIREYLNDDIVIACINSPLETVVAGRKKDLEVFIAKIRSAGIKASFLNVAGAFHSPLMKKAASQFRTVLSSTDICSPIRPVYSTVTGMLIDSGVDLRDHLIKQLTKPVMFDSAFKDFSNHTDVIIEIGPGRTLSSLVKSTTQTPVLSTDSSAPSISSFLNTLAGLFVLGTAIDFENFFSNRYLKKFDLSKIPKFISNPCENYKSEIVPAKARLSIEKNDVIYDLQRTSSDLNSILSTLKNAIAEKIELPVDSIDDEADFLIDLHLNSITVSEIIARTCRALQLPPPSSSNEFANANVNVAAKILFEFQTSGINPSDRVEELTAVEQWARPFKANWIPNERSVANHHRAKKTGEWGYYSLFATNSVPPYIKNAMHTLAGNGIVFFLDKIVSRESTEFVLEKLTELTTSDIEKLVLVQSELGYASVFKSFFLENKSISTLLIDLSNSSKPLEDLSHEIDFLSGFSEVVFDRGGNRLTKELSPYQSPAGAGESYIRECDTVLVTGGGKGITAECAFQLAKKYSCKLIILGRSDVKADDQLQSTLERLSAHKIEYKYYSVDITVFEKLKKTLIKCQKELGPISILLHGAGANEPKRIEKLTPDDFEFCNAVKVQALKNILQLLKSKELKAVFAFGSIIAQSGMSGEAHYGLANDLMAKELEDYELNHSHCRTLCFDWSVWSGIGMGETLGSLEYLRSLGVMPITIDKGVERFISLIQDTDTPKRILVAGRFGTLETLQLKKKTLPMKRFLDSVKLYYPKIELIVEPKINSFDDLYLFDHELDGTLLFPAVLSVEALTQVAMALSETEQLPEVSNLQIKLPIIVDKYKGVKIRISALTICGNDVKVEIRTDSDSYANICVSAVCHFNDQCFIEKYPKACKNRLNYKQAKPVLKVSEFYKFLMFQAGRFQKIQEFTLLTAKQCRAVIKTSSVDEKWFGGWMPQDNYFGSPGVNDSIIHFVQTCVPHKRLVPVSVKRLVTNTVSGPYLVDAKEVSFLENTYCFDIVVRNRRGEIYQIWEQIKFRSVANLSLNFKHPELLENSIQRIVADAAGQDVSLYFSLDKELSKESRKETCVAKVSDTFGELTRSASGRPEFTSGHFASISHTKAITMLAVSEMPIGCDIEIVEHREQSLWHDMLGDACWQYRDIFNCCDLVESENVKMTRLWGLTEGYKKITNENLEYVDSNSVKLVTPNTMMVMIKDLIVISGLLNVFDTETIITIFLKDSK